MNEIIKNLLERKSIRSYTDQEITPQCKEQILRAAMEAPYCRESADVYYFGYYPPGSERKACRYLRQPALYRKGKDGPYLLRRFSEMVSGL